MTLDTDHLLNLFRLEIKCKGRCIQPETTKFILSYPYPKSIQKSFRTKQEQLHTLTARQEMQTLSCPSMPVLHLPEVRGIYWQNKYSWSLLPTLHQQSFTPRHSHLCCCWWGVFWLMPIAVLAGRKAGEKVVLLPRRGVTGIPPSLQAQLHNCLVVSVVSD